MITAKRLAHFSALMIGLGKSQSELIRLAVDRLISQSDVDQRQAAFRAAAGLWENRDDLPDFTALRKEWDRD